MSFDPSRLYAALLNTGLQTKDNPLYQVIYQLITAASQLNGNLNSLISGGSSGQITNNNNLLSLLLSDSSDSNEYTIPGLPGLNGKDGLIGPPGLDGSDTELLWTLINNVTPAQNTRQIGITVDGGGSALTTGVKGYKSFPIAGYILSGRLLADQSGSIVMDVWKDTFANYPPTVADTITASAKPTLSTANHSEDTTLTGWTRSISAGDVFGFNIDSITTITRITLELTILIP